MAWQTPKTNWGAADGVRNTDFNRIEGNILELYNMAAMPNNITIYVSPAGNDTSGSGSSSSPFKTINHALSVIPRNMNGKSVIIDVATGTYPEDVVVNGYNDGRIVFYGTYGRTATINSLTIDSSIVEIRTIAFRLTAGELSVTNGSALICNGAVSISGNSGGLHVFNCSACRIYAQLTVDASATAAVHAAGASIVYVLSLAGSDNENAIMAEEGSIVSYGSTNISANVTGFITRTGGRIYTGGAQ